MSQYDDLQYLDPTNLVPADSLPFDWDRPLRHPGFDQWGTCIALEKDPRSLVVTATMSWNGKARKQKLPLASLLRRPVQNMPEPHPGPIPQPQGITSVRYQVQVDGQPFGVPREQRPPADRLAAEVKHQSAYRSALVTVVELTVTSRTVGVVEGTKGVYVVVGVK